MSIIKRRLRFSADVDNVRLTNVCIIIIIFFILGSKDPDSVREYVFYGFFSDFKKHDFLRFF